MSSGPTCRRVVVERDEHVRRPRAELRHQLVLRAEEEEQLGAERVADADDGQRLGGAAVARELAVDEGAHLRYAPRHRSSTSSAAAQWSSPVSCDVGVATTARPYSPSVSRKAPYACCGAAPTSAPPTKWSTATHSSSGKRTSQPPMLCQRPLLLGGPPSVVSSLRSCDAAASSPNQSCESYVPATCRRIGRERDGTGNCGGAQGAHARAAGATRSKVAAISRALQIASPQVSRRTRRDRR